MRRLFSSYPALYVAVFTLCWAVVDMIGPAAGVSAYEVVWTRYGVHLAFMLLVFGPRRATPLVRTRHAGREILASLLMLGMPLCFIAAVARMPVSDVMFAFWIAPALIAGLATLRGGPHVSSLTWGAIAIGLLGALLTCKPDAGVFRLASVLPIGMAVCFALYVILMRSMLDEPILTRLFHTALWIFISLALVLPWFWRTPTPRGLVAMIAIGLLGWVGLWALDLGIGAMPIAVLAPILYTELAWDALGKVLLNETSLDTRTLIGAALAAAAAVPALVRVRATSTAVEGVHA